MLARAASRPDQISVLASFLKPVGGLFLVILLMACLAGPARAVDGLDVSPGGFGIFGFDLETGGMDLGLGCLVQPDGKLVMVGSARDDDGEFSKIAVARVGTAGTLDSGFGISGRMSVDFDTEGYSGYDQALARAVVVDSLGRLLVVGSLRSSSAGVRMAFVTRLNPNGTIDYSWRYNGITGGWYFSSFLQAVSAAALDLAGNLWILGTETQQSTGGWSYIRLDGNGNEVATETIPVEPGFDITVPATLLFQPSSKPILAGWGQNQGPPIYAAPMLVRLVEGGADMIPDTTFGFSGDGWLVLDYAQAARLRSLAQLPDGKLAVAGESGPSGGNVDLFVQRLTPNGISDGSFEEYVAFDVGGSLADGQDGFVRMIAQSDGKVVLAARVMTGDGGNLSDIGVARLHPNLSLDSSFGGNGTGKRVFSLSNPPPGASDDRIDCLVLDAGKPVIGGSGEYIGTDTDFAFRRLDNAHIFSDGWESGTSFFWSAITP